MDNQRINQTPNIPEESPADQLVTDVNSPEPVNNVNENDSKKSQFSVFTIFASFITSTFIGSIYLLDRYIRTFEFSGWFIIFILLLLLVSVVLVFVATHRLNRKASLINIGIVTCLILIVASIFLIQSYQTALILSNFVNFLSFLMMGGLLYAMVIVAQNGAKFFKPNTKKHLSYVLASIVTVIASLISVGLCLLILIMFISVRVCELSGSSKCL